MKHARHVRRLHLPGVADVAGGIRKISREVGLGVAEALQDRPANAAEPGWRAERFTRGALRGIDEGLEDDHLRRSVARAVEGGVETAISAALAQSAKAEELSEDAARAFARGALAELRTALGAKGDGPLTRSLCASSQRVARETANAVAAPLVVCAVAVVVGLTGVFLLGGRARRR